MALKGGTVMNGIDSALGCMKESGIPISGACRFDKGLILEGVRSVSRLPSSPTIILAGLFPYFAGQGGGNLSLYSAVADYHTVAGELLQSACRRLKQLFPKNEFVPFVDASPIDEVTAALRCGLGVRGKNGQLITKEYGSLVFIGEIVSDVELEAEDSAESFCERCGACVAACPTGALGTEGFSRELCRSHFSQKKGSLSEWEQSQIKDGGLAWGCDICTLACPHNKSPALTPVEGFLHSVQNSLTQENLPELMKNRAFGWRGEAVLRRNLSLLRR